MLVVMRMHDIFSRLLRWDEQIPREILDRPETIVQWHDSFFSSEFGICVRWRYVLLQGMEVGMMQLLVIQDMARACLIRVVDRIWLQ